MKKMVQKITTVIAALVFALLLWQFFSGSERGSYVLLAIAALALLLPFLAWTVPRLRTATLWIGLFGVSTSLGLVGQLLAKESHRYPLYPLTTSLAYLILLAILVRLVYVWIFRVPHSIRFHVQKRYLLYGLGLLALLYGTTTMDQSDPFGPYFQLRIMVWILLILLISNWFFGQWQLVRALESANATAELLHLKSQIQPHFLFNTLNNLYGLAREKSDQTADLILRLSELLRYGLYQAQRDRVPLHQEVDYLQNYLALQRLRYATGLTINTDMDLGQEPVELAPLLLIPLVENAFKHGADHLAENAVIHMVLKVENGVLQFSVENNVSPQAEASHPGIGLDNLRKRLDYAYPDRHHFHFVREGNQAKASLRIDL